ncbi:MAG: T9SS type A sorting domain-containing protein [Candidatus Cyclonatronum sp.]|uniref:T9SS type A sorting domain-containing protein n=1 Tax=Cyclonatronum sp. TaxID=3024185 RepID=UPI0025C3958A|nr:T9SS type A sorting domain-containing protein [Cyclonatronum sp.]MCH8487538.1 T9SS type A sorting domain-containing protein [Cyclonatronum sp.]
MKTLTILLVSLFFMQLHFTDEAAAQTERQAVRNSADPQEAVQQRLENRMKMRELRVMRHIERFQNASASPQAGLMSEEPLLESATFQLNLSDEPGEPDWFDFQRTLFSWEQNRISEQLFQSNFFTGVWLNGFKVNYTYSGNQLTGTVSSFWNDESGWIPESSEVFIYELINGVPYIHEVLVSEEGEEIFRIVITYDGTDITQFDEFESDGNGGWSLAGQSIFEYDGTDLTETYSSNFFGGGELEPDYRTIYLETSPAEFYELITGTLDMLNIGSETVMYLQLNMPSMIDLFWDGEEWAEESRMIRIFANQPTPDYFSAIIYTYSFFFDGWQPDERFFMGFDEQDQILFGTSSFYDFFEEQWVVSERELFVYDDTGFLPVVIIISEYDEWDDEYYDMARLVLTWDVTNVSIGEGSEQLPARIVLGNAYPNPFNPSTNIPFEIRDSGMVNLQVYDILGRRVATLINDTLSAGLHTVNFDASMLSSGIYIIRLQAGNEILTKQITLLK